MNKETELIIGIIAKLCLLVACIERDDEEVDRESIMEALDAISAHALASLDSHNGISEDELMDMLKDKIGEYKTALEVMKIQSQLGGEWIQ